MNKRERAFLLIFEKSFHAEPMPIILENAKDSDDPPDKGAAHLARLVGENTDKVDQIIKDNVTSWDIKRISKVALAALRLCIYEVYFDDVPLGAAVNEAVELCKKYAGEEEASFANGVLRAVGRVSGEVDEP